MPEGGGEGCSHCVFFFWEACSRGVLLLECSAEMCR